MDAQLPGWAERLLAACGVWLVGLGVYFMLLRPALLPEDGRYIGADAAALLAAAPGLAPWLGKVFLVMGGFMAGAGVLTACIALCLMPRSPGPARGILAVGGLLTVGLMAAVNFALHSDFRWLLLLPVVLWVVGVALSARPPR
jgi:hypothetical protein